MTSPIRYAQVSSQLIHAVPMTHGLLRSLCGRPIDPRDLFAPDAQVWMDRSGDRCPGCARLHPAVGGEQR